MKLVTKVAAAVAASAITMSALAAQSAQVPTKGIYAGGELGFGSSGSSTSGSSSDTGFVFGLNAGYQFSKMFGAELGYMYLPSPSVGGSSITLYQFDAALKAMLPLQGKWGMYGKLGISWVESSGTGSTSGKTGVLIGAGATYQINPNLKANAGLQYIGAGTYDSFAGLAGVTYTFPGM